MMPNFFVRFSSCYAALKNVAPLHRTQRRGKFNFRGTFRQNSLVIRECVCACGVGMVTKLRPNLLAHKRGEAAKSWISQHYHIRRDREHNQHRHQVQLRQVRQRHGRGVHLAVEWPRHLLFRLGGRFAAAGTFDGRYDMVRWSGFWRASVGSLCVQPLISGHVDPAASEVIPIGPATHCLFAGHQFPAFREVVAVHVLRRGEGAQ